MNRRIDRYDLQVLVSQTGVVQLWQGWDPALNRAVSLRLLPADDARAAAVAAAARHAATVDDRRLIAILDILERAALEGTDAPGEYLAIVHEWVDGRTLTDIYEEREGEPIDVAEAVPLMSQVAIALQHSHEAGVHHGRLRPGSLLVAEDADLSDPFTLVGDASIVRIRGLAVDAVLWPADSAALTVDPDVHGLGCLLYAMVTGRWPEGLLDGMSPAPRANGRLLPPSQVVADVPTAIDEICLRSIDPAVVGDDTGKRSREPFADIAALVAALTSLEGRPNASSRRAAGRRGQVRLTPQRRALRAVGRLAVAAVALAVVAGIGVAGLRLTQGSASPWGVTANSATREVLTAEGGVGAITQLAPGAVAGEIVPVSADDFDPYGADGEEMPDVVSAAIDAKGDTAWTTDTYYSPDLDGKAGTGIILDLGTAQPVSAVRLELMGTGSSIQVRISSEIVKKPKKWLLLANAEGIGTAIDLRAPRPVVGRYVLIWFTRIPPQDGIYQGGLRDVTVLS